MTTGVNNSSSTTTELSRVPSERAADIEDSRLVEFARFLQSAISSILYTTPRNNKTQITCKCAFSINGLVHRLCGMNTNSEAACLTFVISSLVKQWTCWRAWHSSRKGLALKQNAVTLIISYWSLNSGLLKGPIIMFNWLCRMNKHGLLSYRWPPPPPPPPPSLLCARSERSLACHIAPSLSSSKTNKDVKHQSSFWFIKEDLKYFPLCLTWFWVSPTRGITTGQNKMTFFCIVALFLSYRG